LAKPPLILMNRAVPIEPLIAMIWICL
jgi:hypothetical protein